MASAAIAARQSLCSIYPLVRQPISLAACFGELSEPTLIIACDTVAECQGTILGKPRDEDHARAMLEQLRGTRHRVYSGLCLWLLYGKTKTAPRTRIAITELEMQSPFLMRKLTSTSQQDSGERRQGPLVFRTDLVGSESSRGVSRM